MIKRRKWFVPVVLAVLLAAGAVPSPSQEVKGGSGVTISWEEFRRLLALDKDEINLSWEEFQQILRQTGFKYVPAFELKEERVVLTRAQFRQLLSRMKPPSDAPLSPPAAYLLTQAVYTGRIAAGSIQVHASLGLEVFEKPAREYMKVPLFPLPTAVREALLDGSRALMIVENGRHTLLTGLTGRHKIDVDLSLKMPPDEGPMVVSFPIPQTAVTRFEVDIPASGIKVEVDGAQQLIVLPRGDSTHVEAYLPPSDSVRLSWTKKPSEARRGPAKIDAEAINLLSVEDDALRAGADFTLSILQNSIRSVTVKIPAGWRILDVKGSGIEDWRETVIKEEPCLDVRFDGPKEGRFAFSVSAEKPLDGSAGTPDFGGFSVVEAVREKGFLGVQLKSASEVTPAGVEGLDRLDVSELPAELINRSPKPLLLGYRYLRHPFSLRLDIRRHEELPVIGTVADFVSGTTLFTEDGKAVHRVIYSIRNTSKQFLELGFPPSARVWSVFVGGEPVKPRANGNRILIPLNRSARGADGLSAFDVEVIYFEKAKRFAGIGRGTSSCPVPDMIISQMLWSVYLPERYKFLHFGGTVEKEKTAAGLRLILGGKGNVRGDLKPEPSLSAVDERKNEELLRQRAGRLKSQFKDGLALSEAQIMRQMENEIGFGRRIDSVQSAPNPAGTGLLSIRILIPASGQLFRFAKTLVNEEPMTLEFRYISPGTFLFLKTAVLLALLSVLILFRRRLRRLLRRLKGGFNGIPASPNSC